MRRRKPTSTKQKKASQQLKRAIKRGDVQKEVKPAKSRKNSTPPSASRKLQSNFVKLPPEFLEQTKRLSAEIPLQRPIPSRFSIFDVPISNTSLEPLTCPARPKWRYDMSKLEVERNEEGQFRTWLAKTDDLVSEWQDAGREPNPEEFPRSTTYFERNLEVWRQLWRVTEISQIVLVLLDSRCPLLHFPDSLVQYLTKNNRRPILALTKVSISGPARADAWTNYLRERYPDILVIQIESYAQTTPTNQGKSRFEPHIADSFRTRLIQAIQQVYKELLKPPSWAQNKPGTWKPLVKQGIDWEAVFAAQGAHVGHIVGGALAPASDEQDQAQYLTIGVIGQPNVGKSSLLNALLGSRRVRASKSPGMTKHLQTLFWTRDVRLVDCPGLVIPNFVPMELQVLSGILPISRISAVPACVHFVCRYLPLERIFKLEHPRQGATDEKQDRRTWREGTPRPQPKPLEWTAMDVMIAYANLKGWQTAKAGRPDIHRAGNAILRALAEGRIPWAFCPPGFDGTLLHGGDGIWLSNSRESLDGEWSEGEDDSEEDQDSAASEDEESERDVSEEDIASSAGLGRFGALSLEQLDESAGEDEDEDPE